MLHYAGKETRTRLLSYTYAPLRKTACTPQARGNTFHGTTVPYIAYACYDTWNSSLPTRSSQCKKPKGVVHLTVHGFGANQRKTHTVVWRRSPQLDEPQTAPTKNGDQLPPLVTRITCAKRNSYRLKVAQYSVYKQLVGLAAEPVAGVVVAVTAEYYVAGGIRYRSGEQVTNRYDVGGV